MPQFDITIAGELNLDIILYGLPEELPFEQELLASGLMVTLGSSSAITAHNLAVLGTRVGFVTGWAKTRSARSRSTGCVPPLWISRGSRDRPPRVRA